MLGAEVHAVGDVLHGPQLEKQAQIQHRQNEQTERDAKFSAAAKQWVGGLGRVKVRRNLHHAHPCYYGGGVPSGVFHLYGA